MTNSIENLADEIQSLGINARKSVGKEDLRLARTLKVSSFVAEFIGRVTLQFCTGPWSWLAGMLSVSYSLALEAQLNHTVMHGAYAGLPDADDLNPSRYESIALPFRSKTWGDAHAIHHGHPSLIGQDPDTVHPLFRVHESRPWHPVNAFNSFIGAILVFECWAFDYDLFLKTAGKRSEKDRGEIRKFGFFLFYQYVLFPVLAGPHWKIVLAGNLAAVILRNFIFTGLQTASSVGSEVSTLHPFAYAKKSRGQWIKFQIETSKNFALRGVWKIICGGLDRHIEHHLFPRLPPQRLHEVAPKVKELCTTYGVAYSEYSSIWGSLKDSITYLQVLARPK